MEDDTGLTSPGTSTQIPGTAETAPGDEAVLSELEKTLKSEPDEAGNEVEPEEGDQAEPGDSEDEEFEDFEDGGRKAKIPKWLKPHLERAADYTRKTQFHAVQVKTHETEKAEFEEEKKFHRENVVSVAKIVNLDEQLEAFRKLTPEQWAKIETDNPAQAASLQRQFTLLKDQRERAVGELQQKQQQALEKQRQGAAKQYEDGLARIAKKIPGWSDDLAGKLNAYASENGFSLEELQSFIPRKNAEAYVSALHKAYLFDRLMAKTRAKAKPPEAPPIHPVPTVATRRSSGSTLPQDSDDINTWVRKEEARMRKKAEARA